MSTNKTPRLGLHSWAGSDRFSRTELNDNFTKLDGLKAEDIALSSTQFPTEQNVKAALESLKTSGDSGKSSLVIAVTDKGGTVTGTNPRTFAQIEQGIRSIPTGTNTSDATATGADILSGKTAYGASGKITGSISNRGAGGTVTPGAADQTKAAGYYSTAITIKGEPNLLPANIISGKSIFGVTGTFAGRRWASSQSTFVAVDGSLTVTGLAFRPSIVYVDRKNSTSNTVVYMTGPEGYVRSFYININGTQTAFTMTVNSDGFYIPPNVLQKNTAVELVWIAFE